MKKHSVKQLLVTTNKLNNKYIWMLNADVCVYEHQNAIKILLEMLLRIFKWLAAIIDDMNIFLSTQFIQFLLISLLWKQEGIFPFIRSEEIVPIHLLKALLILGTAEKVDFENYCWNMIRFWEYVFSSKPGRLVNWVKQKRINWGLI